MRSRLLLVAVLCASPVHAAEQNQLSEESQRDMQFNQCKMDAMRHRLTETDYVAVCMRAAGWRMRPRPGDWKDDPFLWGACFTNSGERWNEFCWVRMK
jgi:hypothetical protein